MICPNCGNDVEPQGLTIAPPLGICPDCGRSLVLNGENARIAQAADTQALTDDQKISLRKLRPR